MQVSTGHCVTSVKSLVLKLLCPLKPPMRLLASSLAALVLTTAVYAEHTPSTAAKQTVASASYVGFDTNDYPGDDALPALRRHFAFAGYWLNNPPGEHQNSWRGKRDALLHNDFGFLVLANGKLEAE